MCYSCMLLYGGLITDKHFKFLKLIRQHNGRGNANEHIIATVRNIRQPQHLKNLYCITESFWFVKTHCFKKQVTKPPLITDHHSSSKLRASAVKGPSTLLGRLSPPSALFSHPFSRWFPFHSQHNTVSLLMSSFFSYMKSSSGYIMK